MFGDICLQPNACLTINGRCERRLVAVVQINCCDPEGLCEINKHLGDGKDEAEHLSACLCVCSVKCFHGRKSKGAARIAPVNIGNIRLCDMISVTVCVCVHAGTRMCMRACVCVFEKC